MLGCFPIIAEGFPTIGEIAEPGICPTAIAEAPKPSREEITGGAKDRVVSSKTGKGQSTRDLWEEAAQQVTKEWLQGPSRYNIDGRLHKRVS